MKYLLALLAMTLSVAAADWVYWPDGEPEPVLLPIAEDYPRIPPRSQGETTGYTVDNPAPGWYTVVRHQPADGYRVVSTAWVLSNGTAAIAITDTVSIADEEAAAAAAAAEAEAAAIAAREAQIAAYAADPSIAICVKLLRRHLIALGFTPPWTFNGVKASLLEQVDNDTLDAAGKFNLLISLSLFNMLDDMALDEDDIRAIREYLEANGGT